ncbi:magnetosome-associated protein MamJ-like [Battus philenor]|uniref:magnetosome-associated protein MamJ-like n=1 Tax=Battus philenor TaxID=42288 RepID=UPI0035CF9339
MKLLVVFATVLALSTAAPWSWNLEELSAALQSPATKPEYIPYLEQALNQLMEEIYAGKPVESVSILVPTVTHWSLEALSAALQDPGTNPAYIPYLEHALNEMMVALISGQNMESIPVVIPVGLEPVHVSSPADPAPVLPAPEVSAPIASSPLVQIIINVNHQQQVAVQPPAPEDAQPSPVIVVDEAENIPVNPVDVIAVQPPEVGPLPVDVIAVEAPEQ